MTDRDDVLVIGGGVIGVCVAHYLTEAGRGVTLLDKDAICSGCSSANAGLIAPSSIPLAAPGVVKKALRWMFDPGSPFLIRPRLDLNLIRWLWKFNAACNEQQMRRSLPVLRDLTYAGKRLYDELAARQGPPRDYRTEGLLELFATPRGRDEGFQRAELLSDFGIDLHPLNETEVRSVEPGVLPNVVGGILFPGGAHVDPAAFVDRLARWLEGRGVSIGTSTEVIGFQATGRRISAVRTTRGDFRPRLVVLAAGAWSARLARELSVHLPIEPAKGYSLTITRGDGAPAIPLLLSEAKVAVTPFMESLRFSGTLELAGLDLSIDLRRVQAIRAAVRNYHRCHEGGEVLEIRRGLRPCTPDGMPVIGPAPAYDNLFIATGHGMKGVCLGPITGKLIAQMVCSEQPLLDVTTLGPERFR